MASNPVFRFKQFAIWQDRTAMKVGTDGVLLGCMAQAGERECKRIMDIGTGTGLVAIMLAQRFSSAQVTAVEIDPEAASQATENCANSPFANRLTVVCADIKTIEPSEPYDLIVSNPPYFTQSLLCPDVRRNMARHAGTLTFDDLTTQAAAHLATGGRLAVIIPFDANPDLVASATKAGLTLASRTTIFSNRRKPPRRAVCQFVKTGLNVEDPPVAQENELTLLNLDGSNTAEYKDVAKDFYLDRK